MFIDMLVYSSLLKLYNTSLKVRGKREGRRVKREAYGEDLRRV